MFFRSTQCDLLSVAVMFICSFTYNLHISVSMCCCDMKPSLMKRTWVSIKTDAAREFYCESIVNKYDMKIFLCV